MLNVNTTFNRHLNIRKGRLKVAIGPVFSEVGGVSQYIFGIKKSSSHRVVEVPSKFIRIAINKTSRGKRFYKKYMNKIGLRDYNVVHSNVNPWFTNLCVLSRKNNIKWIHTYHTFYFDGDYPEGLQSWQKKINRNLIEVASRADIKISISKWLHDYLLDRYSIQTEIIPNGVDLEFCANSNPDRFINKYALSDFILFVGNIQPIKNPHIFVKLAAQIPEVTFVMVGSNIDKINLLKRYRISVPKNLTLLNMIQHDEVIDAISACKVFVMTSKREGIPTVLLEAMGMGKPVVVPDHSGCREVVYSNNYGYLYEPNSLDDLIEQTRQALFSNKNTVKSARERVSRNYDWKILARRIDLLYETYT